MDYLGFRFLWFFFFIILNRSIGNAFVLSHHRYTKRQVYNSNNSLDSMNCKSKVIDTGSVKQPRKEKKISATILRRSNSSQNDVEAKKKSRKEYFSIHLGIPLSVMMGSGIFNSIKSERSNALVKGNAPPADLKSKNSAKMASPKTRNIDAAEELGQKREKELESELETSIEGELSRTAEGDRYRDLVVGKGEISSNSNAKNNNDFLEVKGNSNAVIPEITESSQCSIRYRALRLGKRSRDGISGEATTIFSYGYGEDDDKEGDKIDVNMTRSNLIPALRSGLLGMKAGGKRRILVRPERGWFIGGTCTEALDSSEFSSLAANFIVPGTQIADAGRCLDITRIPSPVSYAAKRRMNRRFDESLILEVDVVSVKNSKE